MLNIIINLNLTTSVKTYSLRGPQKTWLPLTKFLPNFTSIAVSIFLAAIHSPSLDFSRKAVPQSQLFSRLRKLQSADLNDI